MSYFAKTHFERHLYLYEHARHRLNDGRYPKGCDSEETCIRGWNGGIYVLAFFYGLLWPALIYVIITQVIIYRGVRSLERRADSFSHSARLSARTYDKSRRVMVQSLLYVGALLFTYIGPTILRLTTIISDTPVNYALFIFVAIVVPLQGVWNCLTYLKPRIDRRFKKACLNCRKTKYETPNTSDGGADAEAVRVGGDVSSLVFGSNMPDSGGGVSTQSDIDQEAENDYFY